MSQVRINQTPQRYKSWNPKAWIKATRRALEVIKPKNWTRRKSWPLMEFPQSRIHRQRCISRTSRESLFSRQDLEVLLWTGTRATSSLKLHHQTNRIKHNRSWLLRNFQLISQLKRKVLRAALRSGPQDKTRFLNRDISSKTLKSLMTITWRIQRFKWWMLKSMISIFKILKMQFSKIR